MGVLDVLRGITKGVGEATGNQSVVNDISQQQERERQAKAAQQQQAIAPLTQALQGQKTRLALLANPDDPSKPLPGKEAEYAAAHDAMADTIGKMRMLMHGAPKNDPSGAAYLAARASDRLHITNDLVHRMREAQRAKVDQYAAQGRQEVATAVQGISPSAPNPFIQRANQMREAGFTNEEIKRANAVQAGIEAKPTTDKPETWKKNGAPVMVDGKVMQPEISSLGNNRSVPAAEGVTVPTPKLSQYQSQRLAFAQSLGKSPAAMTWDDEKAFQTQLYGARQPLAERKMHIAEEKVHLESLGLQLRYAQNDMKDFLAIQKSLAPLDKIKTTSERAEDYVKSPSGPGDAALLFAFVDAVKPGGFRFNQAEQARIEATRGVADGLMAKINSGFDGTVLDPAQRVFMAGIIKQAATQADAARDHMLGATAQLNPRASALAGGTQPPDGPHTTQLKSIRQRQSGGADTIQMKLPDGRIGPIHRSQKERFIQDHPGAVEVTSAAN